MALAGRRAVRAARSAALAALALTALLLASCAPFGTSKRERVERFEADLNYCREFLYENFLEGSTADYAEIRDADPSETWDVWFPLPYPAVGSYTISVDNVFANPIEATIDGPDPFGGPKALKLHMVRSGLCWYLEGLTLDGSPVVD